MHATLVIMEVARYLLPLNLNTGTGVAAQLVDHHDLCCYTSTNSPGSNVQLIVPTVLIHTHRY